MKKNKIFPLSFAMLALSSCITSYSAIYSLCKTNTLSNTCSSSHKLNQIEIGMTKKEVIYKIGSPNSIAAQKNSEYLRYLLYDNGEKAFLGFTTEYYIRLIDGKVESFGKMGDFDSTKDSSSKIEISGETTNNININNKKNKK